MSCVGRGEHQGLGCIEGQISKLLADDLQPPPDVSLNILDFPVSTYHSSNILLVTVDMLEHLHDYQRCPSPVGIEQLYPPG